LGLDPGLSEGQGVHCSVSLVVTPVVGSLLGLAKALSGGPERVFSLLICFQGTELFS